MKKIVFKNSSQFNKIYAVMESKTELINQQEVLDNEIAFNNESYNSIYFIDGLKEATAKIYPGAFSIMVDYRFNPQVNKKLTYLGTDLPLGKIETFMVKDLQNLHYRQGEKKINVYIPTNYRKGDKCDIWYFFDSQNLFDPATSYTENNDPYGGWCLDKIVEELQKQRGIKIIVVGIDNADKYRENELCMNEEFGNLSSFGKENESELVDGHLDNFACFIKDTVHPFILQRYNPQVSEIGIGGASMGGLASFYCGIKDNAFYDYILSYSPAYALFEENSYYDFISKKDLKNVEQKLPKIHIYCGGGDWLEKELLGLSRKMKTILVDCGYDPDKILETFDNSKFHNEESWRLILMESFSFFKDLN